MNRRRCVLRHLVDAVRIAPQHLQRASVVGLIVPKRGVRRDDIDAAFDRLLPHLQFDFATGFRHVHHTFDEVLPRPELERLGLHLIDQPRRGRRELVRHEERGTALLESILFDPRLFLDRNRVLGVVLVDFARRVGLPPDPRQLLRRNLPPVTRRHRVHALVFALVRRLGGVDAEPRVGTRDDLVVL